MPRDAFVLKSKCARKVSGLLRNRPQAPVVRRGNSVRLALFRNRNAKVFRLKITFTRILMLTEYTQDLQHHFATKFCREIVLHLTPKKNLEAIYDSRIWSIERALKVIYGCMMQHQKTILQLQKKVIKTRTVRRIPRINLLSSVVLHDQSRIFPG